MTPENIARVHVWLDGRSDWLAESKSRVILSQHWKCLERAWEREGEDACEDAGIVAAMRGVLLALVREAWNDPHADVLWSGTMWVCTARDDGRKLMFSDRDEDDALISALEASP